MAAGESGDPGASLNAGRAPPRCWTSVVGLAAQIVLLAGLGLYAVRTNWSASSTGLITVAFGPIALLVGGALWWFRGSRLPLILVDLWLAFYGASILLLASLLDRAAGSTTDPVASILGIAWLGGGIAGAIAVWRARR